MPASLLLLACTVAAPARAQLLSPGDLSKVHTAIDGDEHCTKCHRSGKRVDTALCVDCHADIGAQRRQRDGLHGGRFAGDECGHCHVEHRGRGYDLLRWPGGSEAHFQHDITGFALQGAHASTGCRKCHDGKNTRGAHTFLGLDSTCSSCHRDPHDKRFGADCLRCHDQVQWRTVDLDGFDHDQARFVLEGKHEQARCIDCHGTPPRYRGLEFSTCRSCHVDPHRDRFGDRCADCHRESGWHDLEMKRASHPGLSIGGGHARVACARCHDRGNLDPPSRGAACVSCHAPVHEAAFGNDCKRCHGRIRWLGLPERIGRRVHDQTAFALEGKHEAVACEACHRSALPRDERYRGLSFERCADCHRDAHGGEFAARDGGECGPCHAVQGFSPTLFGVELHASTAFSLGGRHVAVPCGGCHGDADPRLDLRVERQACADCHDNPHGTQFAREMASGGCASCHNPIAWNLPNIDHGTWPLTGAHETAACASCHDPTEADRKAGRGASYRGVPRECHGCHADPHLGQFRLSAPERACDVCHVTSQFAIADFDHARLADYPLEGKHAGVDCSGCHRVETLRNGMTAQRFRLGYRACRDCHADPHRGGE